MIFYSAPDENSLKYLFVFYDYNTLEQITMYTISSEFFTEIGVVEVIGESIEAPDWLLVFKPIEDGGYTGMYLPNKENYQVNYCWIKKTN